MQEISQAYGVLSPDGIALRGLFIIDKDGIVQVRAAPGACSCDRAALRKRGARATS